MKHLGTIQLETNRLILRRMRMNDAPIMFQNWTNDERVTRYLTWLPHEEEEVTNQFVLMNLNEYKKLNFYSWIIEWKATHDVIGTIGADYFASTRVKSDYFEIGYCLSYSYWNQGIMSEALQCVLTFLFEEIGAHRIISFHNLENLGSGRVMQKCGMQKEGIVRESGFTNKKEYCTLVSYSILEKEYFNKK